MDYIKKKISYSIGMIPLNILTVIKYKTYFIIFRNNGQPRNFEGKMNRIVISKQVKFISQQFYPQRIMV